MLSLQNWREKIKDELQKLIQKDDKIDIPDEETALSWVVAAAIIPLVQLYISDAAAIERGKAFLQVTLGKDTGKIATALTVGQYETQNFEELSNLISNDLSDIEFQLECVNLLHQLNINSLVDELETTSIKQDDLKKTLKEKLENSLVPVSQVTFGHHNDFRQAHIEGIAGHTYVRQQVVYHIEQLRIDNDLTAAEIKPLDFALILEKYAKLVITTNSTANLRGIKASHLVGVDIETTYTSLRSTEARQVSEEIIHGRVSGETQLGHGVVAGSTREITVFSEITDVFRTHQRLVLLGSPGSGKTTFLSYVAVSFARELLGQQILAQRFGFDDRLLPIFIPLRDFFQQYSSIIPKPLISSHQLLEYFLQLFQSYEAPIPKEVLEAYLNNGHAIILLDGLDEVANAEDRVLVSEIVSRFVEQYPKCRYIISCRTYGYTGGTRLGSDFYISELQDLNLNEQKAFLTRWFEAVNSHSNLSQIPQAKAVDLHRLIKQNPQIQDLAGNPLLLTVIAIIYQNFSLPTRRVELYEECLRVLLGYWDMGKPGQAAKSLAEYVSQLAKMSPSEKRAILEPAALQLHEKRKRSIDQNTLQNYLTTTLLNSGFSDDAATRLSHEYLQMVQLRSGVLKEIELGVFVFSHFSFQEFLAARAIISRHDYNDYLLSRIGDSWWREVTLLATSHLSSTSRTRASQVIQSIANAEDYDPEANAEHLILAAECMMDAGKLRVDAVTWQNIEKAVIERMISRECSFKTRALLGTTLGRLGDPRDLDEMVFIPRGLYWIGSSVQDVDYAVELTKQRFKDKELVAIFTNLFYSELGRHQVDLRSYKISKYPVTNQSYQKFLIDTGKSGPSNNAEWAQKYCWQGNMHPVGRSNHPVVLVSLEDAKAYCAWYSEKTGRKFRLPTSYEWEVAATGGEGYRYPWGNDFEVYANTAETEILDTTSVGIFEESKGSFGVHDLIGNCWEWTLDWYKPYPDNQEHKDEAYGEKYRVARGGSWFTYKNYARSKSRYPFRQEVDYRGVSPIGFRCVEEF